jgi:AcrR family transcriptional regulator
LRPKPEKKEEKEKVRLALLSATLRLAAAHGFASVGLREASREAGIAPTSFYRHFADMEDVGRALVDELVSGVVQRCIARVEAKLAEPADAGAAVIDELFQVIDREPALVRFLIAERVGAFAPIRAALKKQLDQLTSALHRALERARR